MIIRDHFVYAPSQWEMRLQCNVVSHWPSAYTKWSLIMMTSLHGNHWSSVDSIHKGPVMGSFGVFFVFSLKYLLNKKSSYLWHHYNVCCLFIFQDSMSTSSHHLTTPYWVLDRCHWLSTKVSLPTMDGEWQKRQTSNIRRNLIIVKLGGHSDVVGASPVSAAPTTSSFLT